MAAGGGVVDEKEKWTGGRRGVEKGRDRRERGKAGGRKGSGAGGISDMGKSDREGKRDEER